MTTGYVVNLENGHDGYCIESLVGVTFCGETFDPTTDEREVYAIDRSEDHPHTYLCFDCSRANARHVRGAARGEMA
ncbi:hypothetical protein [Natrarchaeobaculum sulfurireducens]|uniref:Uncharacterized protein n=1 Tax=Natrarchaeobaculum sulfurireducens TaxID=2044521 RepID=A0A346PHL8_9EURY|nr:hypothetical protein [Natrarchaeobaculum sulfurireducens]AXR79013.1 hypothetical protein AArc1_2700 [Natrarchaeobaculum sulfurireducens]AXR80809.1 hypothetical protein AArcMg_0787 [Natrarchaeobaculum sulfurireducens]